MKEVAEVYGRGAEKYADRNWEAGYPWTWSLDALERHLIEFKAGESRDELGNHHLACVVFHALALMTYQKYGLGSDDRTKVGVGPVPEIPVKHDEKCVCYKCNPPVVQRKE